jgi:hypothetical protein
VRTRLAGIAAAASVDFDALAVHVITVPLLRLDLAEHQQKLRETVDQLRPRLLVLDPFVRLHRIDENAAAEVAPLLAYLRELQRRFETAVLLVHHARKGAAHARAGQALRGSSELHAWGDSNLYLRRQGEALVLTVEHRAAASGANLALELHEADAALALRVLDQVPPPTAAPIATVEERIAEALTASATPLTLRQLREVCKIRTSKLCEALTSLTGRGRVLKTPSGLYQLAGT